MSYCLRQRDGPAWPAHALGNGCTPVLSMPYFLMCVLCAIFCACVIAYTTVGGFFWDSL